MLTKSKLKLGKGKLTSYKFEIEKRFQRRKMAFEKGEKEYQPMSHEEIRATLQSLKETYMTWNEDFESMQVENIR
jgi:hypothetical protein